MGVLKAIEAAILAAGEHPALTTSSTAVSSLSTP